MALMFFGNSFQVHHERVMSPLLRSRYPPPPPPTPPPPFSPIPASPTSPPVGFQALIVLDGYMQVRCLIPAHFTLHPLIHHPPPLPYLLPSQFHAEARVAALLSALRTRFRQQLQSMLDAPLNDTLATPVVAGE
jgi:hypothetical protein